VQGIRDKPGGPYDRPRSLQRAARRPIKTSDRLNVMLDSLEGSAIAPRRCLETWKDLCHFKVDA